MHGLKRRFLVLGGFLFWVSSGFEEKKGKEQLALFFSKAQQEKAAALHTKRESCTGAFHMQEKQSTQLEFGLELACF
ncbi:hypothetical protein I3843_06G052300 [Carya illinoinensis]|nr:hypothetical protein I3843_06G052300 [Carya illinoinensis]